MPLVFAGHHHRRVLTGLAAALNGWALGAYNDDEVYEAGQRGIVLNRFPETPANLISLTFYGAEHARTYGPRKLTGSRIQIRSRTQPEFPLGGVDLLDELTDRIDRKHLILSDIPVTGEFLNATAPTQTAHYAWEMFSNWRFTALT